jgi:hypothetical protein
VKKTGDIALIGIKCNLYKSNNEFIFKIKMRKKGLHWQVVELTDFLNMGKMIE